MKIDQNLRAAIRSYCSVSNRGISHTSVAESEKRAIEALVSASPRLQSWQKKADKARPRIDALRSRAQEMEDTLDEIVKPFGLRVTYNNALAIDDYEAFAKTGGKLEVKTSRSADAVIAQLAAATPEAGAKILSDLGIKWE